MGKPTHTKNADLRPQKLRFAEWLVSDDREPRTQRELAVVLGVEEATLSDWKRDAYVLEMLKGFDSRREADWARAWSNLVRIACQTKDNNAAVNAIDKMAKLLNKYPTAKVEVTTVERVAYVRPGALRDLAFSEFPELKPN